MAGSDSIPIKLIIYGAMTDVFAMVNLLLS